MNTVIALVAALNTAHYNGLDDTARSIAGLVDSMGSGVIFKCEFRINGGAMWGSSNMSLTALLAGSEEDALGFHGEYVNRSFSIV